MIDGIVPISYGAAGIRQVMSSAFNAMGKPIPSIIITSVHMVGCYIPLAYLGSWIAGPMGIFVAAAIANLFVGLGAFIWSRKTCLRQMSLKEAQFEVIGP